METTATRTAARHSESEVLTTTYLSAKHVAKILGVTPKTVYTWAQLGLIPSVRIGRQVRFPLEDVIAKGKENAQNYAGVVS